jgi:hypothetical protein
MVGKINTCNNITSIEQTKKFKDSQIKRQEIPIDYTGGCLIQKPGSQIKEHIKIVNPVENEFNTLLISSVKVQKAAKNVNGR